MIKFSQIGFFYQKVSTMKSSLKNLSIFFSFSAFITFYQLTVGYIWSIESFKNRELKILTLAINFIAKFECRGVFFFRQISSF